MKRVMTTAGGEGKTPMQELADAIQEAKDGVTGSHYGLAYILRGYGVRPSSDRNEIVKQAEALLDRLTAEK